MSKTGDKPPARAKAKAAKALARARAALESGEPATAREEAAATDPREAPLADAEHGPEPAYSKEAATAPARSAADVASALREGAPSHGPEAPAQPIRLGDTSSPVDLPEPTVPLPAPLRWTTQVIAVATLLLAVLNAQTIRSWAYQLPPSPASARVAAIAEGWYGITAAAGLDRPFALLHGWYGDLKKARFSEDADAQQQDAAAPE